MEVVNFVKQFCYYIHEIAIKETWQQFMDCVLDIEEHCHKYHQLDDNDDDNDDESNSNSDSDSDNESENYSLSNSSIRDNDNKSKTSQARDKQNISSIRSKGKGKASSTSHKIKMKRSTSSFHSYSSFHSSHKKSSRSSLRRSTTSNYEFINRSLDPNANPSSNSIYHGLNIEYNFEGLYLLHHDYLKRILYRCFLHTAAEPIQKLLANIFDIIVKFCYSVVFDKRINKEFIEELYSVWKSKHALFLNKLEYLINKDLVQGDYNANNGREGRWIFNELLMRLK